MICITHPGKHGDLLYASPAIKYLGEQHNSKVDLFTSAHCATLDRIFRYQDYINEFVVCGEREDFWGGWGIQPWDMRKYLDETKYSFIYQLGFRNYPECPIYDFYLGEFGIEGVSLSMLGIFDFPSLEDTEWAELATMDYMVIAPRGDMDFHETYCGIMDMSPIPVVQIGGATEFFEHKNALSYVGVDWLETVSILSNAKAFVGPLSSQTALAHNFDYPKAVIYHPGYGAGIGQRPITQTTRHFLQEQGKRGPVDKIMASIGM